MYSWSIRGESRGCLGMVQTRQSQMCVVTLVQDTRPLIIGEWGLLMFVWCSWNWHQSKHDLTEAIVTNQKYPTPPISQKAGLQNEYNNPTTLPGTLSTMGGESGFNGNANYSLRQTPTATPQLRDISISRRTTSPRSGGLRFECGLSRCRHRKKRGDREQEGDPRRSKDTQCYALLDREHVPPSSVFSSAEQQCGIVERVDCAVRNPTDGGTPNFFLFFSWDCSVF